MAVDYEEGRRLLSYENEFGRQELLAWLFNNRHALLNPDPWRPISEAPTDGTKIVGRSEDNYDSEIVWFGSCESLGLSDREAEDIGEDSYFFESWWCNTVDGAVRLESEVAPTHWMPIPHFRELKGPGQ